MRPLWKGAYKLGAGKKAAAMSKLVLREYQSDAVDAVWEALASADGNCLAVLPTGTGKALCIAEFVRRALQAFSDTRILVVTHSRELVRQNYDEMLGLWPACPAGIYAAGLRRRDIKAQVIFGSIQSLHAKAFDLQKVDLVLVDEAQSIPRSADTTWRRFIGDLLQINPYLRVIGWTATAFRLDSGMLHKGKDALFSAIAYEYNIREAIDDGYLCPPISKPTKTQIDTSHVGIRGGEFIPGQLEAAANDPDVVQAVVDEIVAHGGDRRGWIAFGCGISHCTAIRDAIRERGYSCEGIFATTPANERTQIVEQFRNQKIRCLVSVNALTVGFNAKHVDLIALARPTKSAGLYIQSVGRGTRLFPDKENCLVLDMGGNIGRFGPVDAIKIRDKQISDADGKMPTKICPECEGVNPISARECGDCGAPFPPMVSKISTEASTAAILTTQIKPEWVPVSHVTYSRHERAGKIPSMKVSYLCGLVQHNEWCCPIHPGYARQKFVTWWQRRAPGVAVPDTLEEALEQSHALRKPSSIQVRQNGKFFEIVGAQL